jgi:hypothetical protein
LRSSVILGSERHCQPFDYPALVRTSRPSAARVKPGSEKCVASNSGMASRSSGVTLVPAGVCSLRDSSLQSLIHVRVPSCRCVATIRPVTNSERGWAEVNQLATLMSIAGVGWGRQPARAAQGACAGARRRQARRI